MNVECSLRRSSFVERGGEKAKRINCEGPDERGGDRIEKEEGVVFVLNLCRGVGEESYSRRR